MGKEQHKQRHQSQNISKFIQHPNNGVILTQILNIYLLYHQVMKTTVSVVAGAWSRYRLGHWAI